MNATTTNSSATSGSLFGNAEWNNMGFREKFGDSLFKTDNQKRLQQYSAEDMAMMQSRVSRRFKVEDARIQDSKEDIALGTIGTRRTTSAQNVEQSFGPTTGAQFKAMALRA